MRVSGRLSARRVATAPPGRHEDGDGLRLVVSPSGAKRWVFRFSRHGRRREMGLGSYPEIGLGDARELRAEAALSIRAGRDPIDDREEERRARAAGRTFGEVSDAFLSVKEAEWRNVKHRDQWRQSLSVHAAPLRPRIVAEISTSDVLAILQPIVSRAPETASRVRGRVEAVLDYATAHGLRAGDNPARWRGHLEHLLPKRQRLAQGHHAALPYEAVPAFLARLRGIETIAARALEFAILTAARSGEVYGARWDEIDVDATLWTIPPSRMKSGRVHRVPLSPPALAIVETMRPFRTSEFVFPGQKYGKPLSHIAMGKVIDRLGVAGATPHGFRSAFRDWAGDMTAYPREVAEAALAHTIGDAAEQAYRRGDALEKRRALMNDWALYCSGARPNE